MGWGRRSSRYSGGYGGFGPYIPVAQRRADGAKAMDKLRKNGLDVQPVHIEGRTIAKSFWGKTWCDHVESFADYDSRLERGRTYVRNGSVCHLGIEKGKVEAKVSGSSLYDISISIKTLDPARWESLKKSCAGKIGSLIELLQGKFSEEVMAKVVHSQHGLLPSSKEISYKCSCPDWASMCKHVAAVIYGIGARLDQQPELLFLLRGVDHAELIQTELVSAALTGGSDRRSRRQVPMDVQTLFAVEVDEKNEPEVALELEIQAKSKTKESSKTIEKPKAVKSTSVISKTEPLNPAMPVQSAKVTSKAALKISAKSASGVVSKTATPKPFNATARTIKSLRKKLGLNASEFSRTLGVTLATVLRWEASVDTLNLNAKNLASLQSLRDEAKS